MNKYTGTYQQEKEAINQKIAALQTEIVHLENQRDIELPLRQFNISCDDILTAFNNDNNLGTTSTQKWVLQKKLEGKTLEEISNISGRDNYETRGIFEGGVRKIAQRLEKQTK